MVVLMFVFEHSEIERSALSTLGTVTLLAFILRVVTVAIADDLIRAIVEVRRRIKLAKEELGSKE